MNLNSLFNKQQKLDEYIVKEKELEGQDLLPRKTVALICELYECVNEARFFKFWSENQKARTTGKERCFACEGAGRFIYPGEFVDGHTYAEGCAECQGTGWIPTDKNPLLEEYIDTIHFTLSIANDLGVHEHKYVKTQPQDLNKLVLGITNLATIIPTSREPHHVKSLLNNIIALGYQLGFDEKTVIEAYHEKNKVNYERQENGY